MDHSGDFYSFCTLHSATWEGSSLVLSSIFDHSTILAPINYLMYMFSKVGGVLKSMLTLNEAIIDVKEG